MKTIEVATWEEFEKEVDELNELNRQKKANSHHPISDFLFRGQEDSNWELKTTLERYCWENFLVKEYYRSISVIRPEIETFSGNKWDIPTVPDYVKWLSKNNFLFEFPAYGYMIYLRHHGFPSPLLDWTQSPYVAAFFAFGNLLNKSEKVSIYVYQEYAHAGKSWSSSQPHIFAKGPFVTSHKRHFLQKAEYTVCVIDSNEMIFADHEKAFSRNDENQDILYKFNIPSSERKKVLEKLDNYNLNHYSLFGSEDSLVSTMALRELFLKK